MRFRLCHRTAFHLLIRFLSLHGLLVGAEAFKSVAQ